MIDIREIVFDLVNGIRSGIPFCCVMHFLNEKRKGVKTIAKHNWEKRGEIPTREDAKYVQCDRCYEKKKIVKIKNNGCILFFLVRKRFKR